MPTLFFGKHIKKWARWTNGHTVYRPCSLYAIPRSPFPIYVAHASPPCITLLLTVGDCCICKSARRAELAGWVYNGSVHSEMSWETKMKYATDCTGVHTTHTPLPRHQLPACKCSQALFFSYSKRCAQPLQRRRSRTPLSLIPLSPHLCMQRLFAPTHSE